MHACSIVAIRLHGVHLRPEIRTGGGQPEREAPLRAGRVPGSRWLPALQDRGQLGPEAIRERLPHRPEGGAERGAPAGLATRQLGPGPAEDLHQAPQLRQGAVRLTVEEHLPLLQQVGAIRRVLPVVLVPGPVLGAAVPVGHAAGEQDDVCPLRLQEAGHRLMVGSRRLEAADHLAAPRRPLRLLDPRPELPEPPGGVRDREGGHHHPGVGVPHMDDVLRLGDVEADQEPVPPGTQICLEGTKPLDSDCI